MRTPMPKHTFIPVPPIPEPGGSVYKGGDVITLSTLTTNLANAAPNVTDTPPHSPTSQQPRTCYQQSPLQLLQRLAL